MRPRLFAVMALLALSQTVRAEPSVLLPRPLTEQSRAGTFTVTSATTVQANDASAAVAADRFIALMSLGDGPHPRRGGGPHAIRFQHQASAGGPEAYRLSIGPDGATITASDPAGLFYGGVSLWQILTAQATADRVVVASRVITDAPRFAWRGLLLDSARHFQSVGYIKSFIDWMALHKLNLLHWHLTDDQGWRVEIRHFPKLTAAGPFYRQDEIRALVRYAAARHVTILPEIEMPGHATAAIAAYPQWGVAPVTVTAPSPDAGVHTTLFNVDDATFDAIETILDEVMALFPSRYIHVGGDEAVKTEWQNSAEVQARMKALGVRDEEALQSYFIHRIDDFLTRNGRRLIGWDEILQGGIAPNATVMSWQGLDGAVTAAKSGHDAVLSPWPLLYLDNRQAGGVSEPPGRGRIVSLQDIYDFDPMPPGLSASEARHVIGLQGNLWSEHMRTEEVVTRMAYPRAAAIAEIGWSQAQPHDFADFRRRLSLQQQRYRLIGLRDDEAAPAKVREHQLYSQDLQTCSDTLTLSLEGDGPEPRPIYLVDIMNPCWIQKDAALTPNARLTVAVGRLPFRFQLGKDRDAIHLPPPDSVDGELLVSLDSCDGTVIAKMSLTPALAGQNRLTARLDGASGRHDLCYRFTGKDVDPLWLIDWIDLDMTATAP